MSEDRNIIKLRGLPWSSTAKDILDFLKECQTLEGEKSVHLAISHRDGRPNGEAFVELANPCDVEKAFEYNKNVLGHRYIEIFHAKPEEFEMCLKRQNLVQQDTFIKLRGLPFSCKPDDILDFFQGLEIRNGNNGIWIVFDSRGRPTGEAFVQFCNSEDTDLAMKKNREKIGQRYIEIFRSSSSECRRSTIFNNNGGGSGGGRNSGGMGGFNNDRGMGRGQRNNRTNFRDRPYPDTPWNSNNNNNNNGNNDAPWRNNNRGFGGGNNNFNDNFGGGNSGGGNGGGNNMFNDSNFSSDFERNWNSGGNSFNSFGGGNNGNNNGGGSGNLGKSNMSFDRDNFGFNNFSNNSNSSSGFGNDRFNNGGGNMNSGMSQYAVHLRGMPYDCGEDDVAQFFAPLKLTGVNILYNNNGRHTGEADAYFANIADAQEAMKKHKEKMGSRYIELFAKSNDRRGGNGGGGRF